MQWRCGEAPEHAVWTLQRGVLRVTGSGRHLSTGKTKCEGTVTETRREKLSVFIELQGGARTDSSNSSNPLTNSAASAKASDYYCRFSDCGDSAGDSENHHHNEARNGRYGGVCLLRGSRSFRCASDAASDCRRGKVLDLVPGL